MPEIYAVWCQVRPSREWQLCEAFREVGLAQLRARELERFGYGRCRIVRYLPASKVKGLQ